MSMNVNVDMRQKRESGQIKMNGKEGGNVEMMKECTKPKIRKRLREYSYDF